MRVIVVSDSHGEKDNLFTLSKVVREENVSKVIHLGDDYDDVDFLTSEGTIVEKVPGVFSGYYTEKSILNRKVVEIKGWKVLLSHTKERHENDFPGDILPENLIKNGEIDIMLYGHTHVPAIAKEGNVYLINPGHLKATDKRGFEPSYALLVLEKETIDVKIKKLNTQEIVLHETIRK